MALELPLILGSDPKLASIILHGFLQQNILFDAMAGRLNANLGVSFLAELTNVCSMIGLLVLIFSPSLWKAKYLISWTVLFLVVTLGGSRGFEFAYNFAALPGNNIVNMPLAATDTQCTFEDKVNNEFYCNKVGPGLKAEADTIKKVTGKSVETVASTVSKNGDLTGQVGIKVDNNNTASYFSIYGFKPQVFILYITNRLNFELKRALTNLNARVFKEKLELLKIIPNMEVPEPQIKQWLHGFKSLCGESLSQVPGFKGVPFEDMIAMGKGPNAAFITDNLKSKTFNVRNTSLYIKEANDIQKNDHMTLTPLLDLNVNLESPVLIDEIKNHGTKADKDYIKYFTLQNDNPKDASTNSFEASSIDDIIGRYASVYKLRDETDSENYRDSLNSVFNDKKSIITDSTPVNLIMPKTYAVSHTLGDSDASSSATLLKNKYNTQRGVPPSEVVKIENCGQFYATLINYDNNARTTEQVNLSYKMADEMRANCVPQANSTEPVCNSDSLRSSGTFQTTSLSRNTVANKMFNDYVSAVSSNCEPGNAEQCQSLIKEADVLRIKYAVSNALNENIATLNKENQLYSGVTEGYSGLAYILGQDWTEAWTAPLAGLKAIGQGFKSGAYSALLPVIKNILVAFILVLTPIFFLIGLLVPGWSLGVILTSIIVLLFLQMTDVTMTIIDAVLHSVEKVVSATAGNSLATEDNDSYIALIEVIWGMAYVSSFAITAFLLFAAGNTKAVLSKMAGLDSTVSSTANEIASKGWEITKAGASIAAGAATGGTMGGALGAKTAGMIAQGKVVTDSLAQNGLGETLKGIGGTTAGNYAGLIKSKEEKMAKTAGADDSNLSYISEGQSKNRAAFLQEKKAAEADDWAIEYDGAKSKIQNRKNKAVRDYKNNETDINRARGESSKTTAAALDVFRMTDDSIFDSYEISNGPGKAKTKVMGTAEQLRRFGFDNTLDALRKPGMTPSDLDHATGEATRISNAIVHAIGDVKDLAKRDNDMKRVNFNSSYESLTNDISRRLALKGGDHVDDDTIKKALSNMGVTENNGNFFINDKIVERTPRTNGSSNNTSTVAQNTKSLPGRGNGKKNTRDS